MMKFVVLIALAAIGSAVASEQVEANQPLRVRAHRFEQYRRQRGGFGGRFGKGGAGKAVATGSIGKAQTTAAATKATTTAKAASTTAAVSASAAKGGKVGKGTTTAAAVVSTTAAGKGAAAAAAATLPPGPASLSSALAAQASGQLVEFSASSSALAAKITGTGGNFAGKGSKAVSQTGLALDASQVNVGSTLPGNPSAGQTNSLTSTNNFINYCATQQMPLTNGLQFRTASCNPIIQGAMPAANNIPTVQWAVPVNGQVLAANTDIGLKLNVQNIQTGIFTDAQATYFAAPQTINAQGQIIGHGHFVVYPVSSCQSTTPPAANSFAVFKGIDTAAVGGALEFTVVGGLPAGSYTACSIMSSSNHMPVLVTVAQRVNQDHCVCFSTK